MKISKGVVGTDGAFVELIQETRRHRRSTGGLSTGAGRRRHWSLRISIISIEGLCSVPGLQLRKGTWELLGRMPGTETKCGGAHAV